MGLMSCKNEGCGPFGQKSDLFSRNKQVRRNILRCCIFL
jgi:hypothetical protein